MIIWGHGMQTETQVTPPVAAQLRRLIAELRDVQSDLEAAKKIRISLRVQHDYLQSGQKQLGLAKSARDRTKQCLAKHAEFQQSIMSLLKPEELAEYERLLKLNEILTKYRDDDSKSRDDNVEAMIADSSVMIVNSNQVLVIVDEVVDVWEIIAATVSAAKIELQRSIAVEENLQQLYTSLQQLQTKCTEKKTTLDHSIDALQSMLDVYMEKYHSKHVSEEPGVVALPILTAYMIKGQSEEVSEAPRVAKATPSFVG